MSRWGGRRQWNGRPIDDDWLTGRCVAYWLGMPDRRSFPEVEAAGILAWALAARPRWLSRPHTARFIDTQRERGSMGAGVARLASLFDDASNEASKPWQAEGVSRRTWYYRRTKGRCTEANGSTSGS